MFLHVKLHFDVFLGNTENCNNQSSTGWVFIMNVKVLLFISDTEAAEVDHFCQMLDPRPGVYFPLSPMLTGREARCISPSRVTFHRSRHNNKKIKTNSRGHFDKGHSR